jgi:hypothetical protein
MRGRIGLLAAVSLVAAGLGGGIAQAADTGYGWSDVHGSGHARSAHHDGDEDRDSGDADDDESSQPDNESDSDESRSGSGHSHGGKGGKAGQNGSYCDTGLGMGAKTRQCGKTKAHDGVDGPDSIIF